MFRKEIVQPIFFLFFFSFKTKLKFLETFVGFGRRFCVVGLLLLSQFFFNLSMKSATQIMMRHVKLMPDAYCWMFSITKH